MKIKLLALQKSQEVHHRTIQKQVQMDMRKICIYRRGQTTIDDLRLIWEYNNGIPKRKRKITKMLDNASNQPS